MRTVQGAGLPASRRLIGIMLWAWGIITIPPATITFIEGVTHWKGIVFFPQVMRDRLIEAFGNNLPFAEIPAWIIGLCYSILLVIGSVWYYWSNVHLVARHQLEVATAGALGPVHATLVETVYTGDNRLVSSALRAAGGAIIISGLAPSLTAAAVGVATFGGPAGWLAGLALLGAAALVAATSNSASIKRTTFDDPEETARIEALRREIAIRNVEQFKRKEARKFWIAATIVALVVACNFMGPVLFRGLASDSAEAEAPVPALADPQSAAVTPDEAAPPTDTAPERPDPSLSSTPNSRLHLRRLAHN